MEHSNQFKSTVSAKNNSQKQKLRKKVIREILTSNTVSKPNQKRLRFKSPVFNCIDYKKKRRNKIYQHVMNLGSRYWQTMSVDNNDPCVLEAAKNQQKQKPKGRKSRKGKLCKEDSKTKQDIKKKQDNKNKQESKAKSSLKKGTCPTCGRSMKPPRSNNSNYTCSSNPQTRSSRSRSSTD